jgi:tetratricopeptide (TPR) repeat protein
MKRNLIYSSLGIALVLMSCNPLKKMVKNAALVKYEVTPNPLELKGEEVQLTINGKFPAEYFNKKVKAVVTPVLKYPAESATPTIKKLKPITLIGETVEGEGTKISYEKGGSFSYTDKFTYTPEMETAIVEFETEGFFKKKTKLLPVVKAADGTKITQLLVRGDEKVILAKDNFVRVTPVSYNADIHFTINSSVVAPKELKDADIAGFKTFVDSADEKRISVKSVSVMAYASPDGELLRNENLANERGTSAVNAMKKISKDMKFDAGKEDALYTSTGKGEDWDGFKAEMEKSNVQDKDLIVRILQMYSDADKREQEIKNISKTYIQIASDVLPKLRRSQIVVNAEKVGYSDDELKNLSVNSPDVLNAEELLFAATLTTDLNQKAQIYKVCEKNFGDWRASNNIGYVYFMQNKLSDAKAQFEKALAVQKDAKVYNNLGAVSRLMGDVKAASEYYDKASGAGSEVSYNKGIIDIMKGEYASAVSNLSAYNTFNLALAKVLNGDPEGAMKTIDASDDKASAWGFYLKAVSAARKGSNDVAISNLTEAINKDGKLKEKAKKDAEFIKLREDNGFKTIVN